MVFPREKVTVVMVGRTHVQNECVPMGVLSLLIGTGTMPPVSLWSLSAQKAVTPSPSWFAECTQRTLGTTLRSSQCYKIKGEVCSLVPIYRQRALGGQKIASDPRDLEL